MKKIARKIKHIFKYLVFYKKYEKLSKSNQYNILTIEETINKIKRENYSLSRFGDGEFKWILNIPQNSFQDSNEKLSLRLKEILSSNKREKIIIGLPDNFNSMENRTIEAKAYWSKFLVKYFSQLKKYLKHSLEYGNANVTRLYMDCKDKNEEKIRKQFELWKEVWKNKDLLIIEGSNTRLGIGNDLFDKAKSIKRIICPNQNAFDVYDQILSIAIETGKDKIVLISLGPTATILAYDLSINGIQGIDIGHIDIEYSWFLMKAKNKVAIEGKFVNEVRNKNSSKEIIDDNYKNQIIYVIE